MHDLKQERVCVFVVRCKNRQKYKIATNGNPTLMIQIFTVTDYYMFYDE